MSCTTQIIVEGDDDDCVALEDPNKRHLVDEVSTKVGLCTSVSLTPIVCHFYSCMFCVC